MLILIRMHGTTDQVGTDLFRTSVGYTLREKAQRLSIQPTCSAPQYGLSGQGELAIFEFGIFESLCQLSVGFHVESEHGEHGAERPCLGIFGRLLHDSGARTATQSAPNAVAHPNSKSISIQSQFQSI